MRGKPKNKSPKKRDFLVVVLDPNTLEKHVFSFKSERSRDRFIEEIQEFPYLIDHGPVEAKTKPKAKTKARK